MTEMAQIRGTIELLTKILKANGASKLKAESFRQAKFNGKEAVSFCVDEQFEFSTGSERLGDLNFASS